jgi:hypothetical protein
MSKRQQVYSYRIITASINYNTPTYTQKNLRFNIYELLQEADVWKQISPSYGQFRLTRVVFTATPRLVAGTDPSPVWIYLDTQDNSLTFNYEALESLQGARKLPVKHFSLTSFKSSGRQNDFNYWYDMIDAPYQNSMSIRLRSLTVPDEHIHWSFQIMFYVQFRRLFVPIPEEHRGIELVDEVTTKVEKLELLDSREVQ